LLLPSSLASHPLFLFLFSFAFACFKGKSKGRSLAKARGSLEEARVQIRIKRGAEEGRQEVT